jgi:hypothetical protein
VPRQENHAEANSLLGQLQRGRGEGYRRVLCVPRSEGWDYLLDCICNDPRLDSQVEDRAGYYAAVAIETEFELEPLLRYIREYDHDDQGWNTPLAVETLGELAKRGYQNAVDRLCDYVAWGQWWDWTLDNLCAIQNPELHARIARVIEGRFPADIDLEKALLWFDLDKEPWATVGRHSTRITKLKNMPRETAGWATKPKLPSNLSSLSAKQVLELADKNNGYKLRKVIKQIVKPTDLELLRENVSLENPFVASVALAGLAQLAPPAILDWFIAFWSDNPTMPGFLRARMCEAMISLPPDLTLPLARERLHHKECHERCLAEDLLQAHALPEDIPILREAIRDALVDDEENCYRLCNLVETFCRFPGAGPIPELSAVFTEFRYSYGRARAAEAIHVTAPELFHELALECLWDCEAKTRGLGARIAPLRTINRLHQLASDPWEDESVRSQAKNRLISKGVA